MQSTLVLNADCLPVSVVPLSTVAWQDAIRIIWLGRVDVLEEYDLWVVRSPSVQMRMPSIIRLKEMQHHNGKVEFSRHNIILRDDYTCQYCTNAFTFDDLTFDHVVPRRDGGKTTWTNIVSACHSCNQKKAHHRKMKPIREPVHPTYWQLAANRRKRPITVPHAVWADYLFWDGDVIIDENASVANVQSIDETLPFLKI